jgi:hypothetical protein
VTAGALAPAQCPGEHWACRPEEARCYGAPVQLLSVFQAVLRWGSAGTSRPMKLIKIPVFLIVVLCMPLFMLPLLAVRIVRFGPMSIGYGSAVEAASGEPARRAHGTLEPAAGSSMIAAGMTAIAADDPGFRGGTLTGWAMSVTGLICQSLISAEATPARTFMANGLFRTHQAALALRARTGISCTGSWRATEPAIVSAVRTPLFDEVRVRVRCYGSYTERHGPTGLVLRTATSWSEDLTFGRSADAVSPASGGLPAGHCPSCGAPLNLDPDGACRFCRGIVTAGRHDWVLIAWQREGL